MIDTLVIGIGDWDTIAEHDFLEVAILQEMYHTRLFSDSINFGIIVLFCFFEKQVVLDIEKLNKNVALCRILRHDSLN